MFDSTYVVHHSLHYFQHIQLCLGLWVELLNNNLILYCVIYSPNKKVRSLCPHCADPVNCPLINPNDNFQLTHLYEPPFFTGLMYTIKTKHKCHHPIGKVAKSKFFKYFYPVNFIIILSSCLVLSVLASLLVTKYFQCWCIEIENKVGIVNQTFYSYIQYQGTLHEKKTEIVWPFTKGGGTPPSPLQRGLVHFRVFPFIFLSL